jgi:hypothetical protein
VAWRPESALVGDGRHGLMRGFQEPAYLVQPNLLDGGMYRDAFDFLVPEVCKVS